MNQLTLPFVYESNPIDLNSLSLEQQENLFLKSGKSFYNNFKSRNEFITSAKSTRSKMGESFTELAENKEFVFQFFRPGTKSSTTNSRTSVVLTRLLLPSQLFDVIHEPWHTFPQVFATTIGTTISVDSIRVVSNLNRICITIFWFTNELRDFSITDFDNPNNFKTKHVTHYVLEMTDDKNFHVNHEESYCKKQTISHQYIEYRFKKLSNQESDDLFRNILDINLLIIDLFDQKKSIPSLFSNYRYDLISLISFCFLRIYLTNSEYQNNIHNLLGGHTTNYLKNKVTETYKQNPKEITFDASYSLNGFNFLDYSITFSELLNFFNFFYKHKDTDFSGFQEKLGYANELSNYYVRNNKYSALNDFLPKSIILKSDDANLDNISSLSNLLKDQVAQLEIEYDIKIPYSVIINTLKFICSERYQKFLFDHAAFIGTQSINIKDYKTSVATSARYIKQFRDLILYYYFINHYFSHEVTNETLMNYAPSLSLVQGMLNRYDPVTYSWLKVLKSPHHFSPTTLKRFFMGWFKPDIEGTDGFVEDPYVHNLGNLCNDMASMIRNLRDTCQRLNTPEYNFKKIVKWNKYKDLKTAHDSIAKIQNDLRYPNMKCTNPYYKDIKKKQLQVPNTNFEIVFPIDTSTVRTWGTVQNHCIGNYADRINESRHIVFGVKDKTQDTWFGHCILNVQLPSTNMNPNFSEWQFYGKNNARLDETIKKTINQYVFDLIFPKVKLKKKDVKDVTDQLVAV